MFQTRQEEKRYQEATENLTDSTKKGAKGVTEKTKPVEINPRVSVITQM